MSVSEVSIEDLSTAVLKFFQKKDLNRTGQLKICGVKYTREVLKVWLKSLLEHGTQTLRIAAGLAMVHGHRTITVDDIRQALRVQEEGAYENSPNCVCQRENINPE